MITYLATSSVTTAGRPLRVLGAGHDSDESEAADTQRQLSILACEVCERLEEMDQLRRGFPPDFMRRLVELYRVSQFGYRLTIQAMHGDVEGVCESFQSRAEKRGVTKQDVHYELNHALQHVEAVFPLVAQELRKMRERVTHSHAPDKSPTTSAGGSCE